MNRRLQGRSLLVAVWMGCVIGWWSGLGWAAFGNDIEKPQPKFARDGNIVVATLLPRAKNSSVQIRFDADPALAFEVSGIEFQALRTPNLDIKEFKSAFFQVDIPDVPHGGRVVVQVTSDFFTSSTRYWVCRPDGSAKWRDSGISAKKVGDKTYAFAVPIQDGGEFDADGKADGHIRFIGGPKDGFWSYALGTLVIRFFGVFMVLTILMVGMMAAGRLFVQFETANTALTPKTESILASRPAYPSAPEADEAAVAAMATAIHLIRTEQAHEEEAVAAAIAVGLHLQMASGISLSPLTPARDEWTLVGRQLLQETRLQVYGRSLRS